MQSPSSARPDRRRSSREVFIEATARLLRRQGYAATGLNEIVEASGAPKGSLYFHFPAGKEQLATAAIESSGRQLREGIAAILGSHGRLEDALAALLDALAAALSASGFRDGCPIATVTLELAAASPGVAETATGVFDSWTELIEARLRTEGYDQTHARRRALLVLASIEGALILARARHDTAPLIAIRDELVALTSRALRPRPA